MENSPLFFGCFARCYFQFGSEYLKKKKKNKPNCRSNPFSILDCICVCNMCYICTFIYRPCNNHSRWFTCTECMCVILKPTLIWFILKFKFVFSYIYKCETSTNTTHASHIHIQSFYLLVSFNIWCPCYNVCLLTNIPSNPFFNYLIYKNYKSWI